MHGALECVMHVLSGEWNWVFVCNTYLGGVTLTDVLLYLSCSAGAFGLVRRQRSYYHVLGFACPQNIRCVRSYSIASVCVRVTEMYCACPTLSVCYKLKTSQ